MERTLLLTLLLISILMPWSNALTTLLLIPLGIFSLCLCYQKGLRPNYYIIIILSALFFINVITAIFQENILENFIRVLGQVSLFLVPVFLFGRAFSFSENDRNKILMCYAISTLFMAATNYLYAIYLYYNKHSFLKGALNEVKYDVFSMALIHHHQLYMGMYLSVAALTFFYFAVHVFNSKKAAFCYIATLVVLIFLIVLSARMALLTTIMALVFIILTLKFPFKLKIVAILGVFFLGTLGYFLNPKLKERIDYLKEFSFEYNYHQDWAYQGLALRLMNWECSWEVGKNNFFRGVGIVNVQEALNTCYLEKKFDSILFFKENFGTNFNSHNIYLHTFVASGIFGVLIFILSILFLLLLAFKKRDMFLLMFLFLFYTQGFTESLLYREKGIILFIFFSSILLLPTNPSLRKNNLKIN